jgi:Meiotically Up-regulated Gene 113 (MUG113) protein
VRRGAVYKIGFSRANVERRVRDAEGELILVIPTGQRPSQLEYVINHRFAHERLTDTELWGREWFTLNDDDLRWLQGFAEFVSR